MEKAKIPAPLQRAWAAGVFEGKCKISDTRNELCFESTDLPMMQRFYEIVGVGHLKLRDPGPGMVRPSHRWITKSMEDCRETLRFVLPMLSDTQAARAAKLIHRIEASPAWKKKQEKKADL